MPADSGAGLARPLSGTFRIGRTYPFLWEILMPGQSKTLEDLFEENLKDIYYAERKILVALPKMAKATNSPELKAAFEKHLTETEGQVDRIQQIFKMIKKPAKGKTCPAILAWLRKLTKSWKILGIHRH